MIFLLCVSCAFIAHFLGWNCYSHINHFSSQSLCMVLEGTDFCASNLFPEHFTWQLAHSRCPYLFGAVNNTSHRSSKGHYNPPKAMFLVITGEPSLRNICPSPIPTVTRAHSSQSGRVFFKAEWVRSPGWKINVTQLPPRWILKRKSSGWEEQRLDLPVEAVVPGAHT